MQHLPERVHTSIKLVLEIKAPILEELGPPIQIVNFMDHPVDLVQFIRDQDLPVLDRGHRQQADH